MVLSDLQGKSPEKRRSSVSPRRGQRSRKPRKDWLVAVGQGQSPASTRGQEDAMIKRKKFDISSLSFSGLEGQASTLCRSRSPRSRRVPSASPSPSRTRKRRSLSLPGGGTSSAIDGTPTATATSSPFQSPLRVGERKNNSGVSTVSEPKIPQTGEPAAETSGTSHGGVDDNTSLTTAQAVGLEKLLPITDATESTASANGVNNGAAEAGDATTAVRKANHRTDSAGKAVLRSISLESPGKEYWAGRIAVGETSPPDRRGLVTTPLAAARRKVSNKIKTPRNLLLSRSSGGGKCSSPAGLQQPRREWKGLTVSLPKTESVPLRLSRSPLTGRRDMQQKEPRNSLTTSKTEGESLSLSNSSRAGASKPFPGSSVQSTKTSPSPCRRIMPISPSGDLRLPSLSPAELRGSEFSSPRQSQQQQQRRSLNRSPSSYTRFGFGRPLTPVGTGRGSSDFTSPWRTQQQQQQQEGSLIQSPSSSTGPGSGQAMGSAGKGGRARKQGGTSFSPGRGGLSFSPGGPLKHGRTKMSGISPARDPLGSSFGRKSSRAVSPMQRQIPSGALTPRLIMPPRAYTRTPSSRVTSPSSLPSPTAGCGRESKSPSCTASCSSGRISSKGDGAERIGDASSDRGGVVVSSVLLREESGFSVVDRVVNVEVEGLGIHRGSILSEAEISSRSPAGRPSPLEMLQTCSSVTQEPSPINEFYDQTPRRTASKTTEEGSDREARISGLSAGDTELPNQRLHGERLTETVAEMGGPLHLIDAKESPTSGSPARSSRPSPLQVLSFSPVVQESSPTNELCCQTNIDERAKGKGSGGSPRFSSPAAHVIVSPGQGILYTCRNSSTAREEVEPSTGAETSPIKPFARPSPLRGQCPQDQSFPLFAAAPSPSIGPGDNEASTTDGGGMGETSGGAGWPHLSMHAALVTPDAPNVVYMHVPPGVQVGAITTTDPLRIGGSVLDLSIESLPVGIDSNGTTTTLDPKDESSQVVVGTPTGDGSSSDLSLWVTLRSAESSHTCPGGRSSFSPSKYLSPRSTAANNDGAGGEGPSAVLIDDADSNSSEGTGDISPATRKITISSAACDAIDDSINDAATLLGGNARIRGAPCHSDRWQKDESWEEIAGGETSAVESFQGGFWRSFCGLFDFCRPSKGDRNRCRG